MWCWRTFVLWYYTHIGHPFGHGEVQNSDQPSKIQVNRHWIQGIYIIFPMSEEILDVEFSVGLCC